MTRYLPLRRANPLLINSPAISNTRPPAHPSIVLPPRGVSTDTSPRYQLIPPEVSTNTPSRYQLIPGPRGWSEMAIGNAVVLAERGGRATASQTLLSTVGEPELPIGPRRLVESHRRPFRLSATHGRRIGLDAAPESSEGDLAGLRGVHRVRRGRFVSGGRHHRQNRPDE